MQPRDIVLLRQRETEFFRIMIDLLHTLQLQIHKPLVSTLEHRVRSLALILCIRVVLVFSWRW